MYEEYFGLDRPPFKITPDTSLFYDGGRRGDILGALVYAVHRGEGIIKVVGEVGSGKTMLCRMLQLELPESVEIVYIANPSVSPEDILFVIAHELSLNIDRESNKYEVMTMLQDYLLKKHMDSKQVVLFVEEAQGMPIETLEEIRLLSNLETDQDKLLQIILFGQPELDENLAKNSIRQLKERITHEFNLSPLSIDEIHSYLNFRMHEVGYTGPDLINQEIAKKISVFSGGLLRRINIIADKMMLAAFAEGTHSLTTKHVAVAVTDSGFNRPQSITPSNSYGWWSILVALALVLAYLLYQSSISNIFSVAENQPQEIISQENEKPENIDVITKSDIAELESELTKDTKQLDITNLDEKVVETELKKPAEKNQQTNLAEVEAIINKENNETSDQSLLKLPDSSFTIADKNVGILGKLNSADQNWLNDKLEKSRKWLKNAEKNGVSIQVFARNKSAAPEMVLYLQHKWPLDINKTYLYEDKKRERYSFRVFYNEYASVAIGLNALDDLPNSIRVNSPFLHSINRMQEAFL